MRTSSEVSFEDFPFLGFGKQVQKARMPFRQRTGHTMGQAGMSRPLWGLICLGKFPHMPDTTQFCS